MSHLIPAMESGYDHGMVNSHLRETSFETWRTVSSSKQHANLSNEERKGLKYLMEDKSIVITRPDKGNGVVILDKGDYTGKVETILSDTSKFRKLNCDLFKLTIRKEDRLKNLLKKLRKAKKISDDLYDKLCPVGSRPSILYGLPKIHKKNSPVRPIVSMVNAYSYNLGRYLAEILKPLTMNEYSVKDSFSFTKELLQRDDQDVYMASVDVESLFTNVPVKETIQIILDKLFCGQQFVNGLCKADMRSLLEIASLESFFVFNGAIYEQMDGVAMGSPIGPVFANIFLAHHEEEWLRECEPGLAPVLYRRYVDDTFLLFHRDSPAEGFVEYLNKQHPNMRFTWEMEEDNFLAFLDIGILRGEGSFSTTVYRKKTYTGQHMQFDSFLPKKFKIGLIACLLHRVYEICSNFTAIHKEIQVTYDVLRKNGFPASVLNLQISRFLSRKQKQKNSKEKPTDEDDEKKTVLLLLPFLGNQSFQLRNKLQKLIKAAFPEHRLRLIFRPQLRLRQFFGYKDRVPLELRSFVVYKYTCSCCEATYFGKTYRHYRERVFEHLGRSARTGNPLISHPTRSQKSSESAILDHWRGSGHEPQYGDFKVVDSAKTKWDLLIKESLLIKKHSPSLNKQTDSIPLILY